MVNIEKMICVFSMIFFALLGTTTSAQAKQRCECSLFLKDELWLPKYMVMSLKNNFEVDCADYGKATRSCSNYCSDEIAALNTLYSTDPTILKDYPPSQNIPCSFQPWETSSFSKVCGRQTYALTSRSPGPPVCCDRNKKRIWCGSGGSEEHNFVAEGRKLDLLKDQNDESNNEIDDSFGSESLKSEKLSQKKGTKLIPPGTQSWFQTALTFFGYNSFTDMVKSIDIFSLPNKVQAAVRTYKDEVSLGRCYMEFTTFKVFTKQENPFEDLLRKRRDVEDTGPITRFDEYVEEYDSDDPIDGPAKKAFEPATIKKAVGKIANFLQKSETTRQYADLLNSVIPVLAQMASDGGTSNSSPASMIFQFVAPLLSQMGSKRPAYENGPTPVTRYPAVSSSSDSDSSPFTSLALNMIGNLVSNFFKSPAGSQNRIETPAPTTTRPTQPSTPPPSNDFASSGIRTLIKLFLQSASGSTPVARPIEAPRPAPKPSGQNAPNTEEREEARFIDMVLELIRPIFISIFGNAPGDSGVKEIRKVSTLSTLGRVDDTLREEVDSPFFCFKKYMVNKAWSITENGVKTVVSTFTPEEQARMMRRISSK